MHCDAWCVLINEGNVRLYSLSSIVKTEYNIRLDNLKVMTPTTHSRPRFSTTRSRYGTELTRGCKRCVCRNTAKDVIEIQLDLLGIKQTRLAEIAYCVL